MAGRPPEVPHGGTARVVRIVLATVAAALLIGGALLWRAVTKSPTPVPVEEVLDEYRRGAATSTSTPAPVATTRAVRTTVSNAPTTSSSVATYRGGLPPEGVYRYVTQGTEQLEGPVAQTHTYPDETGIAVRREGCGVTLEWRAFETRADTWTWCPTEDGLAELQVDQEHAFFGLTDRRTFVCEPPGLILPTEIRTGVTWSGTCTSGDRTTSRVGAVAAVERVTVGGTLVDAVRVEVVDENQGSSSGTARYTYWLRPSDGLLLRFEQIVDTRTGSPIGTVDYTEHVELLLQALEPER